MIEEKLVQNLKRNELIISSVESCTGGKLIDKITNIEGASYITNGGLVTYSNEQKIRAGISSEIIKKYGVYSSECAETMASVGLDLFDSDICVGITGTLSNIDLNNIDSEQGRVFYSIMIKEKGKYTALNSIILVPTRHRNLQKEYIVNQIIIKLNEFLKDKYRI